MKKTFLFLLLTFPSISFASGPSFNCSKARSPVELAICSNTKLAQQDLDLSSIYKKAKSLGRVTIEDQIAWIKQRERSCEGNVPCILDITARRISYLRGDSQQTLDWRHQSDSTANDEIMFMCAGSKNGRAYKCANGNEIHFESCAIAAKAEDIIERQLGHQSSDTYNQLCKSYDKLNISQYVGFADGSHEFFAYFKNLKHSVKIGLFDIHVKALESPKRQAPSRTSSDSSARCITVSGDCVSGFGCIVDEIKLSGGPGGHVDNSWSAPTICSGYKGALNGTYQYTMRIGDKLCSGSFPVTSRAQTGVSVSVYSSSCDISSVNEY